MGEQAYTILRTAALIGALAVSSLCLAQRTASIVGNKVVYFPPVGQAQPIAEAPLPIPDDPVAVTSGLTYTGQVPQHSQYVQLDDRERILFFIVDGDVFDRDGYLIARRSQEVQTTQPHPFLDGRVKDGRGEVVVAPVPGRCGAWYIVHSRMPTSQAPHILGFSVLDLDQRNQLFPTDQDRHGKILDWDDFFAQGYDGYMDNFNLNPFVTTSAGLIPDDPNVRNGPVKLKSLYVAATGRTFLLVSTGFALAKYEMKNDGIQFLGWDPIIRSAQLTETYQTAKGELEAFLDGSTLVVALTYDMLSISNLPPVPFARKAPFIYITNLNLTTTNLAQVGQPVIIAEDEVPVDGPPVSQDALGRPINQPGIGGLEFSANGQFVYWLKSYPGPLNDYLGCWDRLNNQPFPFGGLPLLPFLDSKLELHGDTSGVDALYVSGTKTDGTHVLGALLDPNAPLVTAWSNEAFTTSSNSLCVDESLNAPSGPAQDPYHLLDKQGLNDQTVPLLNERICCDTKHRITGFTDYTVEVGAHVWTATDNPFYDLAEVRISGELRIPTGANVVANDITFRFGPDAVLVIERGAKFTSDGCTFTSGCEEPWAGIRVEGYTSNPVQTQTGTPLNHRQGWLLMDGSTVENARVGIWCTREETTGLAHTHYYGGVARVQNSTLRNCTYGVRVENYTRRNGALELDNLSRFTNCEFSTTSTFPNGLYDQPRVHATVTNVRGITFTNCRFLNTDPGLFQDTRRGRGIQAFNAGFKVLGNDDPNTARFENLSIGVVAFCWPLRPYTVDRMHFVDNMWGVYDVTSIASRITRNTFQVPDWDNFVRPPTGLYVHQSTGYLVEENTFNGYNRGSSFGIYFYGPQQAENRIYNNSFSNLMAGTMVSGRHKGNDPPYERQGLQILCGDYEENSFDFALGSYTYIREDQGDIDPVNPEESQLAGNRWLDEADLSSTFDIWIDPEQYDGSGENPSPFFDYKRHDVAICDPLNTSPFFSDQLQPWATEFIKEVACDGGNLVPPPGPGTVLSRFSTTAAELKSAVNYFTGTVNDGGENLDIIEAIGENHPPLASHVLRDYLLARTPLHDDVMIAMVQRSTPMDAWHVTQVLLANCKLSSKVWGIAKNVAYLSPYQIHLIETAVDGSQVMQLLKREVAQKSSEKAKLQTHVLHDLLTDSTTANKYSTVLGLLAPNADLGDQFYLANLNLMVGETQLLDEWLDSMEVKSAEKVSVLRELLQMREAELATWPDLPATYANALQVNYDEAQPGSSLAAAIGYHLEFFEELPPIQIPDPTKARHAARTYSNASSSGASQLELFPNPTSGKSYLVLPSEAQTDLRVVISDALGRVAKEISMTKGARMLELDLSALADGFYTCEVLDGDIAHSSLQVVVNK